MTIYNKLVRDRIPEMIRAQGETPHVRILDDGEYTACLEEKLVEEVQEFRKERNLEELADILEVVHALAENLGRTREDLEKVYRGKHDARGGFRERVFLLSKE